MKLADHFLTILESFHDAIIIIAKDSTVIFVNKAYVNQFNVPANKIIGKKLNEIEPQSRILEVLKSGVKSINDFSYVRSLQKHVYANITPLVSHGETIGVVTIMKDISETTKLQNELRKYKNYSMILKEQIDNKNYSKLKTKAPKMKKAVDMTKEISATDATVVLYGESGVGKEVFAKAIHESSNRFHKPFVPINMSSIPDSLFESELFGHEEGSFTGARSGGKKGILEMAHGGTVLLDEIGELSLNNQSKLLRFIQERSFHKIGGTKLIPVDIRLVFATNRNLMEEVKAGNFREDLYYRINVVPITIPPLRERVEDMEYLTTIILEEILPRYNKQVIIATETFSRMKLYDWPGNVRELINVLERMVAFSTKSNIEVTDLPDYVQTSTIMPRIGDQTSRIYPNDIDFKHTIEKTERDIIEYAVKTSKNKTEAIQRLGISRKTFYKKIKKYGFA